MEVLRIASILGESFALADLSAVSGRTSAQLLGPLGEAISAALLGAAGERLAFRHELVREAIYTAVPLPLRHGLHAEAAAALAFSGASAATVAQHLLLGSGSPGPEAVCWLRRAAREAAPHAPQVAELRVARLAADGLANPQIGERMFISRRTVETHLSHVLAKLGLTTRARLAAEIGRRGG